MSIQIRNFFAIVVFILALSQTAGYVTGNQLLRQVGKSFMFSPLPMPFRQSGWYENYVYNRVVTVIHRDGSVTTYATESEAINTLPGSHRYKVAFITAFYLGPVLSESLQYPVYEYAFCIDNNPMHLMNVQTVEVNYESKRTKENVETIQYQCKD